MRELTDFRQSSINPGNFEIWYSNNQFDGTLSNLTVACHTLYAMPFYTGLGGHVDLAGIHVRVAATSGTARMALYEAGRRVLVNCTGVTVLASASPHDVYPGQLILDCGTFLTSTPGRITMTNVVSTVLPPRTLLWIALVCHERPGIHSQQMDAGVPNIFGGNASTLTTEGSALTVDAVSYDQMFPISFPESATFLSTIASVPVIGFRVSVG